MTEKILVKNTNFAVVVQIWERASKEDESDVLVKETRLDYQPQITSDDLLLTIDTIFEEAPISSGSKS